MEIYVDGIMNLVMQDNALLLRKQQIMILMKNAMLT